MVIDAQTLTVEADDDSYHRCLLSLLNQEVDVRGVAPVRAVERVLDGVEESRLAGAVLPGDEPQRPVVKLNLTIGMAQEILDIN